MVEKTIELPPHVIERFEELARTEHRPADELMREVLTVFASQPAVEIPAWAGLISDPELSSERVHEYLEQHWKSE